MRTSGLDRRGLLLAAAMALTSCNQPAATEATSSSAAPTPTTIHMRCGDDTLIARYSADGSQVRVAFGDHQLDMQQAISASGARYVAADDDSTEFWSKGAAAWLKIGGHEYPECSTVDVPSSTAEPAAGAAAPLLGVEWVVEDLDGNGIVDDSRATLVFGSDGSVAGRASCNRYSAQYTVDGSKISLTPGIATMMACAPALMTQEQRFFDVIKNAQSWQIDDNGLLHIHGSGAHSLRAHRE